MSLSWLRKTVEALTLLLLNRTLVLLPAQASGEEAPLTILSRYRIDMREWETTVVSPLDGDLQVSVSFTSNKGMPTSWIPMLRVEHYAKSSLQIVLGDEYIEVSGRRLPLPTEWNSRRFNFRFEIFQNGKLKASNIYSHYLATIRETHGSSYFSGGNYSNYDLQASGEIGTIVPLLKQYSAGRRILDVGCATGVIMSGLRKEGYEVFGVDISDWAVEVANKRMGCTRAWVYDIEKGTQDLPLPEQLGSHGPFDVVLIWAVYEHFSRPDQIISRLRRVMAPGALLVLNTTNSGSLTHWLYDSQWEGYFDPTHSGVGSVNVETLQHTLQRNSLTILKLDTHMVWDGSAYSCRASVRDWYSSDSRFRQLLHERNAGDFITCVARLEEQ